MVKAPASGLFRGKFRLQIAAKVDAYLHGRNARRKWLLWAAVLLLSPIAFAQEVPQVTSVDPSSGKVNDTVTVAGANLGKSSVAAVFLSNDSSDFKTTVVDQSAEKIVVKVPQVKSGDYNISLQVGDKIFIKPVKFKVEE